MTAEADPGPPCPDIVVIDGDSTRADIDGSIKESGNCQSAGDLITGALQDDELSLCWTSGLIVELPERCAVLQRAGTP